MRKNKLVTAVFKYVTKQHSSDSPTKNSRSTYIFVQGRTKRLNMFLFTVFLKLLKLRQNLNNFLRQKILFYILRIFITVYDDFTRINQNFEYELLPASTGWATFQFFKIP